MYKNISGNLFHGELDMSLYEMVFQGHAVKGKKLQATIFLALGEKPKPFLLMSRTFHGIKRHLYNNINTIVIFNESNRFKVNFIFIELY